MNSVTYIPASQLEAAQDLIAGHPGHPLLISCSKDVEANFALDLLTAAQQLIVDQVDIIGYFSSYLVQQP